MLRLGGLLHDFYVQPIEAIWCDHSSDFVLIIQVWQIFIFLFDLVKICSKNVVSQMIEVHMSVSNPRGRWLGGLFPTSSHNLIIWEVG